MGFNSGFKGLIKGQLTGLQ